MRTLTLLLALALLTSAGCKKGTNKAAQQNPNGNPPAANPGNQPGVHAPTGVVMNPAGGGGGAAMAVRKAAYRAVSQNDLEQLKIFIYDSSLVTGNMPDRQTIEAALRQAAPAILDKVQKGDIVLTGTRSRENVWAYTREAQSVTGEHLVLTKDGVGRMTAQALNQQLQQQQGQ